jgi:hydrogenase/urease accessory protein HupE
MTTRSTISAIINHHSSLLFKALFFLCVSVSLCQISTISVFAHEVRPAYLELREEASNEFHVLWKVPARGEMRLSLHPKFSVRTENLTPISGNQMGGADVQTWRMRTVEPLRGQTVRIAGLEGTMTDALVRVEFKDGTTWVRRLTPQETGAQIPLQENAWSVSNVYLKLGVEHILFGIDHLLFVLALLIITSGSMRLVKTITAFTLAHSITLGLATLGFVHVPGKPVEAVIALSIVFVALEILRRRKGRNGITERAPWIVAFTFGLLHGFGFAGALSEVGLPQGHIPLALMFFNLGVEAGQLLFVAAILTFTAFVKRAKISVPRWAEIIPPYAIGSMAMFWVIQRVAAY